MKITKVIKSITYYVETDSSEFPYYRTNKYGTDWENLMGESWEPCYSQEEKLQKLFLDYKNTECVEELW